MSSIKVEGKYLYIASRQISKGERAKLKADIKEDGGVWSQNKKGYYFVKGVPERFKLKAKIAEKKKPASNKEPVDDSEIEIVVGSDDEVEIIDNREPVIPPKKDRKKPVPKPKNFIRKPREVILLENILPVTKSSLHMERIDIKKFFHDRKLNIQSRALSMLFKNKNPLAVFFALSIHRYSNSTRGDPKKEPSKTVTVAHALSAITIGNYVALDLDFEFAGTLRRKLSKKEAQPLDLQKKAPKEKKVVRESDEEMLEFSGNLDEKGLLWLRRYAKLKNLEVTPNMGKDEILDSLLGLQDMARYERVAGFESRTEGADIDALFGDEEPFEEERRVKLEPDETETLL